jgi:hypothetical protein
VWSAVSRDLYQLTRDAGATLVVDPNLNIVRNMAVFVLLQVAGSNDFDEYFPRAVSSLVIYCYFSLSVFCLLGVSISR